MSLPLSTEHRRHMLRHLERQAVATLTKPQRRAAERAAAHRQGRYENDGSVQPSTWRRMLTRMWLAGFAEETDGDYTITQAARITVRAP